MSPGARCDQIIDMIDEVLGETGRAEDTGAFRTQGDAGPDDSSTRPLAPWPQIPAGRRV